MDRLPLEDRLEIGDNIRLISRQDNNIFMIRSKEGLSKPSRRDRFVEISKVENGVPESYQFAYSVSDLNSNFIKDLSEIEEELLRVQRLLVQLNIVGEPSMAQTLMVEMEI